MPLSLDVSAAKQLLENLESLYQQDLITKEQKEDLINLLCSNLLVYCSDKPTQKPIIIKNDSEKLKLVIEWFDVQNTSENKILSAILLTKEKQGLRFYRIEGDNPNNSKRTEKEMSIDEALTVIRDLLTNLNEFHKIKIVLEEA